MRSRLRFSVWTVLAGLVLSGGMVRAQTHNYAEAFQKALFFYEVQASGVLPADHRVEWRGDSCTRDGADVGRDLTGGWYDAGDGVVWTGNDGFGASMLAWSLHRHRNVYLSTGQYRIAIDRVREISAYLEKIVQLDGNGNIERIYCGKGAIKDAPPDEPAADNDRTEGCPNEVMDSMVGGAPQAIRPSYWVDDVTGGADVAGAVAAALAANAIVLREFGDAARADELLTLAKKAYAWGEAHPNLSLTIGGSATSTATRRMTNGSPVTIASYANRSSEWTPRMMYAAAWLHRADVAAATPGYTSAWIDKAEAIYNSAANASKRSKHWVNFATGSEQNGAYAMLAADSGRSVFVTEANAYADFWLYSRSNHSALPGDPTTTPEGFICRGQGAGWNTHALLDQAPPLLDWADSTFNTNATRKARLVALYTGTYNAGNNECPVKQIDYILGSNTRKLSYLQGYKPAGIGYDWVKNLHHRPTMWAYGGFGTPPADKPEWNTATAYGTLCPGPDKTDFYPVTKKLTDTLEIAYQEPIIYSGGILTVLARNIALGGPSAGSALTVFPDWETRPADYQTQSFFVRASKDSATRYQCYLNNRARLAPREINTLGFRYYFTPDGVAGSAVSCTATGSGLLAGESVGVSGPTQVGSSTTWYFEIKFNNAMIVPGEFKRCQRKVQLDFSQSSGTFNPANDHSGSAITSTEATIGNMPVYDTAGGSGNWKLLGGFEPSAGYIQWRRAHFNNVMEGAGSVLLIAERVGGTSGAVSATVGLDPGTAGTGDYGAPGNATLSWASGESGEKTIAIPLTNDSYDEGRESFTATLGALTVGAAAGIVTQARVSIEDDDFGSAPDPNALVQVLGNNAIIADGDSSPSAADHTDFGSAETGIPESVVTRTFTLHNLSTDTALQLTGSPAVLIAGAADFTVVSAPPASIAPGESASFQIRFAASVNGTRSATVSIASPQVADGSYSFAIRGTGTGANPVLVVSAASITSAVSPGGSSALVPVTLQNSGRAALTWSASLPANYTAITSTASGGPAYEWIDITTAGANQGTVITSWGASSTNRDDNLSGTLDIGFSFPYYGSKRSQFKVSTNGLLTFDTSANGYYYSNYTLPSSAIPATAICPWWDDLYLKANQGDIYYKRTDADTFVITWNRISYYNGGSPTGDMSFQVILKRDGRILCQYKNVMAPVDSTGYTIGIQNSTSDSAQACQYAYNTKTADNGITLEFRPPPTGSYDVAGAAGNWAVLSAASGNVGSLSSGSFNLTLNTAGLPSGTTHRTAVTLTSNDPAQPVITIPVTLTATRSYNLATSDVSNRAWETAANWSPNTAFPGPNDDLACTRGGGSLRIDGPRTIRGLTLIAAGGLTLTGTGFGGSGTGATLTTNGPVTIQQGALLAGGSTAKLQLNGGLALNGGSFGFAAGANGTITVADDAPITLSGGILDTLVNSSATIYRQALGTGDVVLSGSGPEIRVSEDTFTLARRLTGAGGFKKSGAGTLVLAGTNADPAGTTEIAGGTIKLGANNPLGSDSLMKLGAGTLAANGKSLAVGTLELAGNATIDCTGGATLVFADSSGVAWTGTRLSVTGFGASASIRFGTSGSTLTPAQLSKVTINGGPAALDANGYLFGTSGLSTIEIWRKTHFATTTNSGNAANIADPDADDLCNLLEYALGGDPTDQDDHPIPTLGTSGDHLTLTFTPHVVAGLAFTIEASDDLASWPAQADITGLVAPGVQHTHTDSAALSTVHRRFLRLKITQGSP